MSNSEDLRDASNNYQIALDELEKAQHAVTVAQQTLAGAQQVATAATKKAADLKVALKAVIDKPA
jgi:hypothetical protein